ncbi:MAG: caspase family protein [Chloroflexi bacterium]|nr:caspase family protein [Chloroflexota bacterium]
MGADLPVTITDALEVAKWLRDPARCAYPPDQVRLLTGPAACRSDVLKALDQLAAQVKADPDTTTVVYFSGHDTETPDYYFLPYDYSTTDLPSTAVSDAEFTDRLRTIRARKLMVLLDC